MRFPRSLAMIVTAVGAAAALVYLQQRSAAADAKAGLAIAQDHRGASGRTLSEILEAREPGAAIIWSSVQESACFSHVRVEAHAGPRADYVFLVDLNGPSIHPGNPAGEEAIRALESH
jgi:hypothetical protein